MKTPEAVAIEFYFHNRRIRLVVDIRGKDDRTTPTGLHRTGKALTDALDNAERQ